MASCLLVTKSSPPFGEIRKNNVSVSVSDNNSVYFRISGREFSLVHAAIAHEAAPNKL